MYLALVLALVLLCLTHFPLRLVSLLRYHITHCILIIQFKMLLQKRK